jgi:hypothetical protein
MCYRLSATQRTAVYPRPVPQYHVKPTRFGSDEKESESAASARRSPPSTPNKAA